MIHKQYKENAIKDYLKNSQILSLRQMYMTIYMK